MKQELTVRAVFYWVVSLVALAVVWRSGFGRDAAVSSAHVEELHQLLGGGAPDSQLGGTKAADRATSQLLAQAEAAAAMAASNVHGELDDYRTICEGWNRSKREIGEPFRSRT